MILNIAILRHIQNVARQLWTPFEINMSDDIKQWHALSERERDAFLHIIGLLSILDSVQPNFIGAMKEYITDPSVKAIFRLSSNKRSSIISRTRMCLRLLRNYPSKTVPLKWRAQIRTFISEMNTSFAYTKHFANDRLLKRFAERSLLRSY